MTKKKSKRKPSSEVLTELDMMDLYGAADVLSSLLNKGAVDPEAIRFVGYLMLSLADRFEDKVPSTTPT